MPHYKHPDSSWPEALSFTQEEWRYMIDCFLTDNKTEHLRDVISDFVPKEADIEPQLIQKMVVDGNEKSVIFWTQDCVGCLRSVYSETYNGNYDEIETMFLPRNDVESWNGKYWGIEWRA